MVLEFANVAHSNKHDITYKVAHIIYAQSGATSLRLVEAMTSMIANAANVSGRNIEQIIMDESLFDVLNPKSQNHNLLTCNESNRGFQMCLRTASRMMNGRLPDVCYGAIRFHRADVLPDWATSIGYIYETDGFLFYT